MVLTYVPHIVVSDVCMFTSLLTSALTDNEPKVKTAVFATLYNDI